MQSRGSVSHDNLLLSICVPTFNRKVLLEKTLKSIITQLSDKSAGMVEIVISDNASSDGTNNFIDDFQFAFQDIKIRYYRQSANIGAIENVYFVARAANGSFVYIVADDDNILPGALDKIVEVIQSHPNLGAICPRVDSLYHEIPNEISAPSSVKNDSLIFDKDQALIRLGTMITFLSSVIFPKTVITDAIVNNPENHFPHSFFFLKAIESGNGCLFISQHCMELRGNDSVNYDFSQAFVIEFTEVLEYAKQLGYSSQATRVVLSKHAKWLVSNIAHFRKTCYRPNLQKRIQDSKNIRETWLFNPFALLCLLAVMWLPISYLDRLKSIFKRVRYLHFAKHRSG